MDAIARQMRAEYVRSWRRANPDKVRQYNQTYWEKKAAERKKATETASQEEE